MKDALAMEVTTENRILELVTGLIQTRGFNAMSYQHIADAIGIRKASIHYYFRTKADLGVAVIRRYSAMLRSVMEAASADEDLRPVDVWRAYLDPISAMARDEGKACLCGVLASEFGAISPQMQSEVTAFFEQHQVWLAELFEHGRTIGDFDFAGPSEAMGAFAFSTLQGALLLHRANGSFPQFSASLAMLDQALGVRNADMEAP